MWKINEGVVYNMMVAARNTYPHEFFSLLGGDKKKKLVKELVIVPAIYGESFTLVKNYMIPIDRSIVGSIHSHPSVHGYPSMADVKSFGIFGDIHFILANPYTVESLRAYDAKGRKAEFKIVRNEDEDLQDNE